MGCHRYLRPLRGGRLPQILKLGLRPLPPMVGPLRRPPAFTEAPSAGRRQGAAQRPRPGGAPIGFVGALAAPLELLRELQLSSRASIAAVDGGRVSGLPSSVSWALAARVRRFSQRS